MVRLPAVSGHFYPTDPEELVQQVASFCEAPAEQPRQRAIACMVPHAGYRFSGHVAGSVYGRLQLPRRFLLLGPRHFPRGKPQAIVSDGAWQTPLGRVQIDSDLAFDLKAACPSLMEDDLAHRDEHALEVQVPFLQCLASEFCFVPVALAIINYAELEALGRAIASVLMQQTDPVLIVASSDMNHYESDEITREKDNKALADLLTLDPRALYDTVRRENITMCGFGPAVAMLTAARLLGATRAKLVRYATSGDINGERDQVVGYAGVIVE
jgi:AmmeMemoRadiSam system protein B